MKKYLIPILFISFVFTAKGYGTVITFGDSVTHWTGWGGGVCTWNHGITDDSRDAIGTPNVTGGTATVEGATLNAVSISYSNSSYYGEVTPGDLFIDMGSNGDWDFIVDTSTSSIYSFAPGTFLLGSSSGYRFSGDRDNWSGSGPNYDDVWVAPYNATWDIRDDHPVLYSGNLNGQVVGQANISPSFISTVGNQIFVYSGLNLGLTNSNFTLGWTIDCANDVIYEKVSAPVPEPATLLLLGSGLLGLASFRRKRNR